MQPDPRNQKPAIDGVKPAAPATASPAPRPQPPTTSVSEPTSKIERKPAIEPKPITDQPDRLQKRSWRKKLLIAILCLLVVVVSLVVGAYAWYQQQLSPASSDTEKRVRVTIAPGTTPARIAQQLESSGVIRSQTAFAIYTKLTNTQDSLKAGAYNLQPSVSTPAIVRHLVDGKQDTFRMTFLPGDTLANNREKLIKAGFTAQEVDAALSKTYGRPLFAGKPADADLEGYIFGETYEFTSAASVETILNRTFEEFEAFIQENNLEKAYAAREMTMYEGITLASIIQKEVSGAEDSRQVAQVFYKRLSMDMPLGADATFVYAAKKANRQPIVDFQSPYNTRINKGLPPGPISVPGVNALRAVASPTSGDYLYFVSGDDGKNYFSRTLAEHEANTRKHCIKNCALF